MKKVEAVIPHARMQNAFSALRELDLGGLTYYESKGRGEIPTPVIHGGRGTSVFRPEFNVNVTISIVVRDPIADNVVGKILESTVRVLLGKERSSYLILMTPWILDLGKGEKQLSDFMNSI